MFFLTESNSIFNFTNFTFSDVSPSVAISVSNGFYKFCINSAFFKVCKNEIGYFYSQWGLMNLKTEISYSLTLHLYSMLVFN